MMDAISGTLKECATHWFSRYGSPQGMKLLEQFTSASGRSITRWFTVNLWPNGIKAIKLMVFVQLFGYDVAEEKKIDANIMRINRAIAFGVISFVDAQKLMRMQADSASRVLQGKAGTSSSCIEQIRRYIKMHGERIETAEKIWQEKIQKLQNPDRDYLPAPLPVPAVPKAPTDAVVDDTQVATFNTILSVTNSLSDIAQMHIDSAQLSDSQKLNFVLAMSHLCKLLGIRSEALTQLLRDRQEKTTADLGEFQSLLKIGGR